MKDEELSNFFLAVVEACDIITSSDSKLFRGFKHFDDHDCYAFLRQVQKIHSIHGISWYSL